MCSNGLLEVDPEQNEITNAAAMTWASAQECSKWLAQINLRTYYLNQP